MTGATAGTSNIVAPVPEPSSVAVSSIVLPIIAAARKRRRRSA
jgi:hypothetical protein